MIQIYTDGGSRGNPGPAAYGFVVISNGEPIHKQNGYIGVATNNIAEYTAVIEALKWLSQNFKDKDLQFFMDSQLVVSQMKGIFKVKNANIRDLLLKIRELESNFKSISVSHVPREKNKEADLQVNLALDTNGA